MVGELLAASPAIPTGFGLDRFRENVADCVRRAGSQLRFRATVPQLHTLGWINNRYAPSIDSLVSFSHSQGVNIVRLLTERVSTLGDADRRRRRDARYRVSSADVEITLRTALLADSPLPLTELARRLGYRTIASLKSRYPALCAEISRKRRSCRKGTSFKKVRISRDRIERAFTEELSKDGLTSLQAVARRLGLCDAKRLRKGFNNLRRAIVAKNELVRKQRLDAIEKALRAALCEHPVPTATEVAHRLGFRCVNGITSRVPELSAELSRRRRSQSAMHARKEKVRKDDICQRLTEALTESPPPSLSEVVRRVASNPSTIRRTFPGLCRALSARYMEHKRNIWQRKRQVFIDDVRRAVAELHQKGIYPILRLVLGSLPEPQYQSPNILAEAVLLAREELSIESYAVYRSRAGYFATRT